MIYLNSLLLSQLSRDWGRHARLVHGLKTLMSLMLKQRWAILHSQLYKQSAVDFKELYASFLMARDLYESPDMVLCGQAAVWCPDHLAR